MHDSPRRAAAPWDDEPALPRRAFAPVDEADEVDDEPAARRGLGFADEEALDDDTAFEGDDDTEPEGDDDPRPARAWAEDDTVDTMTAGEMTADEPAPYRWTPRTEAVWEDVWAGGPAPHPVTAPAMATVPAAPRTRWGPRLPLVTATAATVIVAAAPLVAGALHSGSGALAAPAELPIAPTPVAAPPAPPTPEPEPTAAPTTLPAPPAILSAPKPPPPVTGIPQPCSVDLPFPASGSLSAHVDRMERQWGLRLTGSQWRDEAYRPVVRIFSETMDAVDCTDYLRRVNAGNGGVLEISSGSTGSWAWGDYGLTRTNVLTLDFAKFKQGYAAGDRGRLVRLIVHEMAHSLNSDRDSEPAYWQRFHGVWQANGKPTAYGSNETEAFADAVGYYVARCAADNPYSDPKKSPYYEYVKANIFAGREFGGPVATRQVCEGEGR